MNFVSLLCEKCQKRGTGFLFKQPQPWSRWLTGGDSKISVCRCRLEPCSYKFRDMAIKYTWHGLLHAHGCTRFNEAFLFCSLLDEQPPQQDLQKPQELEAADLLIEDVQAPTCQMREANSTPNKRTRVQICSFWFTRSVALATRQRRRRSWRSLSHTVIACPGNVKCSFVHLTGSRSDWRTFNRIPERSKIPQGAVIKFLQALFEILHPRLPLMHRHDTGGVCITKTSPYFTGCTKPCIALSTSHFHFFHASIRSVLGILKCANSNISQLFVLICSIFLRNDLKSLEGCSRESYGIHMKRH